MCPVPSPYTATDKTYVECNHACLRLAAFKGKNFDRLAQGQIDLITSHVNGNARPSPMKGPTICRKRFVLNAIVGRRDIF